MKFLFAISIFAASLKLFAVELNCSMANSIFTLKSQHYSGGVPPFPGMQTGRVEWRFNGEVVFRETRYEPCDVDFGCEREVDPASNIEWSEIKSSKKILLQEGGDNHYFTHTIYAVKIELKSSRPGQTMTGTEWEAYSNWFVCDYRYEIRP